MSLLELKNISKIYHTEAGETIAVDRVDLQIEPGEFVAIMGPSGSGKSTLMHMLGLLDRPTSGTFLLHNEDVTTLTDDELAQARNREIGFVFQAFNLLPKTSVYENVELPLLYAHRSVRDKKERILGALEAVGMGHRLSFTSNQLSGGEKQRVAIARALVNSPSLVFADEPTGNLDSKTSVEIMKLFGDIHANGNTVILVTHEEEIAAYAHRVIRLRDGMIESDTTK